ncbi:MAG TPA: lipocalin-like domain-containing protein [Candidatus Limnocylindrales bacterium]|nr:lipocalin-like domain-containing protein [Candidatus Limnocylindrales bacterium]
MKKLLSLGVVTLFAGMATISGLTLSGRQELADNQRLQDRFIGAWRLVWLEEPDGNGKIQRADCTGLLVYTRDGHMSVQVMYRNAQTGGQAGPVQYAQGGYEASFGTYQINESAHSFTFHVEGAMVRSLIGKDLARAFELSGKQLIVKSSDPNEHWRVAWERY